MSLTGRIYKIYSPQLEICYIGSTCNTTRDRFCMHKRNYRKWLRDETLSQVSIFPYFKEHGVEQFKCVLVKEYQVADKKELLALEQLWINKFRTTAVNKNNTFSIPIITKEKVKQYYKQYRESNKDKIKEKDKQYHETNKDKINDKKKQYREANEDKLKAKFDCNCGGKYTHANKAKHMTTKKHQESLKLA